MRFRYKNKELKEKSDYEMLRFIVVERETDCTSKHSLLYKRLEQLEHKLFNGLSLTRG